MSLKIVLLFKNLAQKLKVSLRRFPEAIVLAVLTTIVLVALNHADFADTHLREVLGRTAMALALGIPLTLCFRMLFEKTEIKNKNIKVLVYFLGAISLVLYYFYLLPDFKINHVTRYIALNVALYCGFAIIPYFGKRPGFEQYVAFLIGQFLITALYSVVLFLGLIATVFTIDQLLFSLPSKIYFDIWLLVVGIFAPAFFLSDVPSHEEDLTGFEYSKVVKALLSFIVLPLITVYTAILYLYFAKILITRQWPVGMVSHLVLWYSLVTIFVSFITYPMRNINRWIKNFLVLIPKFIIPLLIMMFVAIGIRIKAYGVTENRYFVLITGIWALGAIIYLSFVKEKKHVFLVFTLACVAVLAVFGPWSAYSISKLSQKARFEAILERNQMLQNGTITKAPANITDSDKQDLSSIVLYFNRYHDLEDLSYLPQGFEIQAMEDVFGFPADYYYTGSNRYFYFHAQDGMKLLDIREYDYFYDLSPRQNMTGTIGSTLEVTYQPENKRLIIKQLGEEIYNKDLNEIGLKIYSQHKGKDHLSQEQLSFTDANQKLELLYLFRYLGGYAELSSGNVVIDPLEFNLFIKLK